LKLEVLAILLLISPPTPYLSSLPPTPPPLPHPHFSFFYFSPPLLASRKWCGVWWLVVCAWCGVWWYVCVCWVCV
jgi:hypothetical protein